MTNQEQMNSAKANGAPIERGDLSAIATNLKVRTNLRAGKKTITPCV